MKSIIMHMFTCLLVLMPSHSYGAQALPSAKDLMMEINRTGARKVLDRLWNDREMFDKLCIKIASGKEEWLEVAAALRPVSDAGSAESLEISTAAALPNNPRAVLQLVQRGFDIRWVCGEPRFGAPAEDTLKHFRRALSVLEKVNDPSLREQKQECIGHIQSIVKIIEDERKGLTNR